MRLARVKGNVVSSEKHPCFNGHKLLLIQPIDHLGNDDGTTIISCDRIDAGPGDIVLFQQEGNSARDILGTKSDPFHSVIVAIVDKI